MKTSPVALWIWYRGDRFRGYQRQVEGPTVQAAIEEALAGAGIEAAVAASGRTDLGVHARMQVLSFRPKGGGDAEQIARSLAARLPEGMGIAAAAQGAPAFHAQWSATSKEYRYRIALREVEPGWAPLAWSPATHERLAGAVIRAERLAEVVARIAGTRDFIAFHEKSSVQKARAVRVAQLRPLGGALHEVRLEGEGFARYMVRYLVGTAVAVAAGVIPDEEFVAALETGRALGGLKAPAHGLVLWEVGYPPELDPFAKLRPGAGEVPKSPPFIDGIG